MKNYYILLTILGFSGIAAAQGITFASQNFGGTSTICCGVDMNGDGLDDIVTTNVPNITVYTQKASGGFDAATYNVSGLSTSPGWSIAAGDFDRNGFNDLALGGGSRLAVVKANNGGAGFTRLVNDPSTQPNPQTNNFNPSIFTQRTNFVDINNDGNLDLFACHDVDQSHVYRNDGEGNLVFDIPMFPTLDAGGNYATVWVDYDNDGDIDMYMAKCRGGAPVGDLQRINLLYTNNGDGTYTENAAEKGIADGLQSWSTAWADYDNDGDMDFVLSNVSSSIPANDKNRFYLNNGDGTFTDIYESTGLESNVGSWEVQCADFNNDGFVDFLWQNSKQLWMNNGDLTFTGYSLPFSEGAIGDYNNDGFLDVQIGSKVWYNSGNPNKWLTVKLQGVESNINGIGARIEIYGAWGKQIREIRSGEGFSHMSTLNAHFGIGNASAIDKVIVRWPSGTVDTIIDPSSNQSLVIVEGSAVLKTENFTSNNFSVFPNPANEMINLRFSNSMQINTAKVYDLSGRMVLDVAVNNQSVDVKSLSSGSYILTVKNGDGQQFTQKFLKK